MDTKNEILRCQENVKNGANDPRVERYTKQYYSEYDDTEYELMARISVEKKEETRLSISSPILMSFTLIPTRRCCEARVWIRPSGEVVAVCIREHHD
jgi:hypothetical protein